MFKRITALLVVGLLVIGLVTGCGNSGTEDASGNAGESAKYPNKTIYLISHGKAGGGMDTYLRQLGKAMEEKIDVPVVIEDRVGGASAVATSHVATSAPDGYVLLGTTNTHVITPLTTKTEHSVHDLVPVCRMLVDPLILTVRADNPWNDLEDVLKAAEENPGEISWGTAQAGSPAYMVVHELQQKYGVNVKSIPFEGGAQLVTAVAGGHVDVAIAEPGEVEAQVQAGKLKIIGTFTEERLSGLPDVKTAKEQGYDIVVEKFRGIMAPKGTSPEVIDYLEGLFKDILENSEAFKDFYTGANMEPAWLNSEEFGNYLDRVEQENTAYLESLGLLKK
ncbi:MAG: tripartite tricarboxylate transporter substrate binding protein [Peptococcaceae bacterium]|nr:tripartite tricarboxylate transporter substrate binding protein [Peptococcaceae bacterium]